MTSAYTTDGAHEVEFLRGLTTHDNALIEQALTALRERPIAQCPRGDLPGSNATSQDTVDLDGFACVMSLKAFEQAGAFKDDYNTTIGGATVPTSSIGLARHAQLRFVGTANSAIFLHVPSAEYTQFMNSVPYQIASPHANQASATQRRSISGQSVGKGPDCFMITHSC